MYFRIDDYNRKHKPFCLFRRRSLEKWPNLSGWNRQSLSAGELKCCSPIKNGICELKNETVILSSRGNELQEKMNIFTKVHNQIKVEGNEANTLIDNALDKLGQL